MPASTAHPAQAGPSLETAQAPAPPGLPVWHVETGSSLDFTTAWAGQPIRGRFDRWRAEIAFDPEALDRSRVRVSIDLASVNTGDAQRDAVLPGGDWLGADTHPQAVFTADKFERAGEGRFVAHGRLELRGVSRPLDLPFVLKVQGREAEARGSVDLDRTVFGVGQGEWTSTTQIPAKVGVSFVLRARRVG